MAAAMLLISRSARVLANHRQWRERETVDLLLQDLNTKQIASRMDISPNTAKAFLRSVMIKVGAENRAGIIGRILQSVES